VEDVKANAALAKTAHELVENIRIDLPSIGPIERRPRRRSERLLRKHRFRRPARGGGGGDRTIE
jgi:hypothetical protein